MVWFWTTDVWLYSTNSNNGTRVGTNDNKTWTLDAESGYLKHVGTGRYLGVYVDKPDWRAYTNTTGNTAGQTLKFWKLNDSTGETDPVEPTDPVDPTDPEEPVVPTEPAVETSPISDVLAASEGMFTVKGVVTLVDGSNIYVQDTTGAICVRMAAQPEDIALGDTIIGSGSKTVYNGLPQLADSTY